MVTTPVGLLLCTLISCFSHVRTFVINPHLRENALDDNQVGYLIDFLKGIQPLTGSDVTSDDETNIDDGILEEKIAYLTNIIQDKDYKGVPDTRMFSQYQGRTSQQVASDYRLADDNNHQYHQQQRQHHQQQNLRKQHQQIHENKRLRQNKEKEQQPKPTQDFFRIEKKDFAILPPASEWCRLMGFRSCGKNRSRR